MAHVRTAIFIAAAVFWIGTAILDVPAHFSNRAQPLGVVAGLGAVAAFVESRGSWDTAVRAQRALAAGVAALIAYSAMVMLAPWLIASVSVMLGAAGLGVLLITPSDRVSSWVAFVALAYVVARGIAFFATTFWRGAL